MRIIPSFDPSAKTSGTIDIQTVNKCATLLLYNESNIGLLLTFPDGSTAMLPAWWAKSFKTPVANTSSVAWKQNYILNSTGPPVSLVIGEAFEPAENAPVVNVGLSRQTNVGNAVSTTMGGSTTLQNDGNISGVSIVEATVSGDSGSAVGLTNDGHLTLGTLAHPGSISFDHGTITSDGTGIFTLLNRLLCNLIIANTGNDITLNVATGHKIALQVNSSDLVDINASGLVFLSGGVNLLTGSITRISKFAGGAINGVLNISHNLGAIPDLVLVVPNLSGTPVNVTIGVNYSTFTSTKCDVWANSTFNFVGFAIKF